MSKPETPLLTVDIIIEVKQPSVTSATSAAANFPIIFIERRFPPHGWALPGGFVDVGETLEQAAIREAKEETCCDVTLRALLGCYSNPNRDHRGHTVSAVYIAETSDTPQAADDAINLQCFLLEQAPQPLCFDHTLIIDDYGEYMRTGKVAPIRPD